MSYSLVSATQNGGSLVRVNSHTIQIQAEQSQALSFTFSLTARCKAKLIRVGRCRIVGAERICCFTLFCSSEDSPGRMSSSVTYHFVFLQSNSSLPMWIYLKMYGWFRFCLPVAHSPLPSVMKAIFFSFPTLTAGVCCSPATLQLRPALCIDRRHWESLFRWLLLLWIYMQHCAMLYIQCNYLFLAKWIQ